MRGLGLTAFGSLGVGLCEFRVYGLGVVVLLGASHASGLKFGAWARGGDYGLGHLKGGPRGGDLGVFEPCSFELRVQELMVIPRLVAGSRPEPAGSIIGLRYV